MLGSFPIEAQGYRLHVTDPNIAKNELEDTTNVKKFELTEEEYSKTGDMMGCQMFKIT